MDHTTNNLDLDKLEALARAPMCATTAVKAEQAITEFHDAASPAAILELIALARLAATHKAVAEGAQQADRAEAQQDAPSDTEMLDALAANYWDLRCVNVPTGGDDCDVTWRVIEHHMGAPRERVIADAYGDNPRHAIFAAVSSQKGAQDNG